MSERPLEQDDPAYTRIQDTERRRKLEEAEADAERERNIDLWGNPDGWRPEDE